MLFPFLPVAPPSWPQRQQGADSCGAFKDDRFLVGREGALCSRTSYNHMSSKDADAPQMHSVTHSSIIPSSPFWGSEVLLRPAKEAAPPAFRLPALTERKLHVPRPSGSAAFLLLIAAPLCRKGAAEHNAFPGFILLCSELSC